MKSDDRYLETPATAKATENERALVAGIAWDLSTASAAAEECAGGYQFLDADLGKLYDAIQTIVQAGLGADIAVIVTECRKMGVPEAVTSAAFIARLLHDVSVHKIHTRYYARQVAEAYRTRQLHSIAERLLVRAHDETTTPDETIAWVQGQLAALGFAAKDKPGKFHELAVSALADLLRPRERGQVVMTGLELLDQTFGAWMGGELVVLAARPSVGKTALASQIAMHNAAKSRPVLFVSLEMTSRELVLRELCGRAGLSSHTIRTSHVMESDVERLQVELGDVGAIPLWIWAPPAARLSEVRAMAMRQAASADGLGLLVVDYLQLVRPDNPRTERFERVTQTSEGLKAVAKELGVPVLALCQLNREAEGVTPTLATLRDSGAIEQDADIVTFLHRESRKAEEVAVIVAKFRHGKTGAVKLIWDADAVRFRCAEAPDAPNYSRELANYNDT